MSTSWRQYAQEILGRWNQAWILGENLEEVEDKDGQIHLKSNKENLLQDKSRACYEKAYIRGKEFESFSGSDESEREVKDEVFEIFGGSVKECPGQACLLCQNLQGSERLAAICHEMYKRWKRMSGKFVRKNKRRLCKDKYKDKLDKYWSKQKKRAERQYQAHLKAAVAWLNSRKKAIKGAETSVSDDESEVGEAELAGPDDTRFIGYLKRETRKTEKKVREYLRRCGFTIIPRGSKKLKKKLKKIRKKYARKMKKVTRTPPPEAQIAKDKTYGITLGLANGGNPNNIGIGVEDLKKDKNGNTAGFTPWKFNKDKDFKRNSYDVGISFGRRRRRT